MFLVSANRTGGNDQGIKVPGMYHNPLGILDKIGLAKVRLLLDKYIFFPSPKILYVKAAQRRLAKIIQRDINQGRKVCVINSLPHHDLSLVGLYLKKKFPSVKWIVDWRDLWSFDDKFLNQIPSIYHNKLIALERSILDNCDLNVTTNSFAKEILVKNYNLPANKVTSIEHAFSREDIECKPTSTVDSKCKSGDTINIGFLGNLLKPPKISAVRILNAIKTAKASGIDVVLNIYGDSKEETRDIVNNSFSDIAVLHKRVSHNESLKTIASSDFLLLALEDRPNCHIICHAKLPHYLMLGKPILAIVPDKSYIAKVISDTNTGFVIPPDENCEKNLISILQKYKKNGIYLKRNNDIIEEYSWESISKKWIDTINQVCIE